MPPGCANELRASEKREVHSLLTTTGTDVGALLQCSKFSSLNRLLGIATIVLRFCSLLRSKANPEKHTWFEDREELVAEQLLVKFAQTLQIAILSNGKGS